MAAVLESAQESERVVDSQPLHEEVDSKGQSNVPRKMNYPLLLKEVRRKRLMSKDDYHALRKAIKAQSRTLRNVRVPPTDAELMQASHLNPWDARLPGMHKYFFTRNPIVEARRLDEIAGLCNHPSKLFDWLNGHMISLRAYSHTADVPSMEALSRALGTPRHLTSYIRSILEDEDLIQTIADRSYHQDLFDKLVLMSGKDWKLRMHIFEVDTFKEAQEEIHSHRDHFVSYCVRGGLHQQIWEELDPAQLKELKLSEQPSVDAAQTDAEASTGRGHVKRDADAMSRLSLHKYAYDPTMQGDTRVFRVQNLGRVHLGPIGEEQQTSKGDTYYMHPSVLHSVEGIEGKTVTLVLNRRACDKSCFASPNAWTETFVRQKISPLRLKERLQDVLAFLTEDKKEA